MSEDSGNFTFFAPVKLSPEERDSSIDTCLSDKLGDYDRLARILTSDSPEREELAGINSGTSSSTRPAVTLRGYRNPAPTSSSVGGNEGAATNTHHKSSSSSRSAPNPKKHWKHQFTGGDPSDVNSPQKSSSNHKSDRFSSPLAHTSEASIDSGIFSQIERETPGARGNSSSSKGGHSNSSHSRLHNNRGGGKKSSGGADHNVDGKDNKVNHSSSSSHNLQSKPSTVSQYTNNQRNHRQSNNTSTSTSSNPISSHYSSSASVSAFTSSSNERDYVTDDVIEPAAAINSENNAAQLTTSPYQNSSYGINGASASALTCASSELSNYSTNAAPIEHNNAPHSMSTTTGVSSAAGGGSGVKSVTSSGSGRGSSSKHSSTSSNPPHSGPATNPNRQPTSNSSNTSSRSGELNHNYPSGAFKVYSGSKTSFNRKHKLNQCSSSSSSSATDTGQQLQTSQINSSRGDREVSGGSGGVSRIGQGSAASTEQTNELYQTHYHSNGAMSNESKRIKLATVKDWADSQSKDIDAFDVETTNTSDEIVDNVTSNSTGRSFQPIRGSAASTNSTRVSSPLLTNSSSSNHFHKSRSPARSLLSEKDVINDRNSSPVDFISSPSKHKTPSHNNQYHNNGSKQENTKQNCSSSGASPCHLQPKVYEREASVFHHAEDVNVSKQTAYSPSPAPLTWKGTSHGGRRSPLKGHDKSKQSGPPMARVAPMTRHKPQSPPAETIPGSHREDNADAMRALHLQQYRNNLATDPRVLRAEQILKEFESLKTPDPILFPISSGSEPNNNHKPPFDFESIFLPNSDPIALLEKEMPEQVLNLPKVQETIMKGNGTESLAHPGKADGRRGNQPTQYGHENAILASDRRLKSEFVEAPSGAVVSMYSEGLLGDRGVSGRGSRERDKQGHGDRDRSRDVSAFGSSSRDKLNHHHSSPPHSSISSISTSAQMVASSSAAAYPHASVVHHSSREDITNKAFQSTIPGSNAVECSVDKESNSRSSNSYNNMRDIDEFRDNVSPSKSGNMQRVPVKQERRPHASFNANQTPTNEDFDRLNFQNENSNSDPLSGRDGLEDDGRQCAVKEETDDHPNLAKGVSDSVRREKKDDSNDENNEEHTNCNDDLSSSSSSSSSEDEDSGSEEDDEEDEDEEEMKASKLDNGVKEEPMDTSETEVHKNQDAANVDKASNAPVSNTSVTPATGSNTSLNSSSSRPSWSLASFGVAKLSTSPSPKKNQSKHATGSTRSRSTGNSRGANSDRSASGSRNSNSSSKHSLSSCSKSQNNPPVPQPQPPSERQNDDLGKLSDTSVSPPIKVVATRKEHTAAIAAKNKDKIASVHPFSKTSTKKSTPETSGGHVSSLTPLISPNKVNKQQSKTSAYSNSIPPISSKRNPPQTEDETSSSVNNSKKQKKQKKRATSTSTSVAEEEHMKNDHVNESAQEMYDDVSSDQKNYKERKHKPKGARVMTPVKREDDFSTLKLTHFETCATSGSRVPVLNFVLNVAKLVPPAPDVDDAVEQENPQDDAPSVVQPEVAPSKKRKRGADHEKGANKKSKKQSKHDQSDKSGNNGKKHDSKQAKNEELASSLTSPLSSSNSRPCKNSDCEASLSSRNHERSGNAPSRDVSPVGMKHTNMSSQSSPWIQRKVTQKSIASKEVHNIRNTVSDAIDSLGMSSQCAVNMDTALMSTMSNGVSAAAIGSPCCSVTQDHDTLSNSNFSGSEMASDDLNPILGNVGFNGVSASSLSHGAGGGSKGQMGTNQFFLPSTSTSNVVASGALSTASSVASSNSNPAAVASDAPHSGTRQNNNDSSGLKTFYWDQARNFKRKADNGSKLQSCLDYAQAVIYYISYAVACLNSNDSLRAFKIFTSKEIKSIINVAMKLNVKHQNASINQDRIDIVTVLLMKIRGYTEIQAYNVRKEQSVRYVGTLADFIRDRNEHASTSNGRMDPESPTQSVASYGSNSSGTHLQRDSVGAGGGLGGSGGGASSVSSDSSSSAGGGGVNSSSAINMPADMYSIFESYIDASRHLIAAHDTWDQAVLLLKRPNVAKFYCTVDQECGYTVNIQSQPEPFINYCNAVISLIRPKMVNNNSLASLPPLLGTSQAANTSANNQQSNTIVTANHNSHATLAS